MTDAEGTKDIRPVFEENVSCYGAEKIGWQLHQERLLVAETGSSSGCELGIFGATRTKSKRTTVAKEKRPLIWLG